MSDDYTITYIGGSMDGKTEQGERKGFAHDRIAKIDGRLTFERYAWENIDDANRTVTARYMERKIKKKKSKA